MYSGLSKREGGSEPSQLSETTVCFRETQAFIIPEISQKRVTTAKQQNSSPNQQNKVSFFHLRGLKTPPSRPFAITEAIKNCYLQFDGVTPFDHCSSADDSLTFNIHSFHIHSIA